MEVKIFSINLQVNSLGTEDEKCSGKRIQSLAVRMNVWSEREDCGD